MQVSPFCGLCGLPWRDEARKLGEFIGDGNADPEDRVPICVPCAVIQPFAVTWMDRWVEHDDIMGWARMRCTVRLSANAPSDEVLAAAYCDHREAFIDVMLHQEFGAD